MMEVGDALGLPVSPRVTEEMQYIAGDEDRIMNINDFEMRNGVLHIVDGDFKDTHRDKGRYKKCIAIEEDDESDYVDSFSEGECDNFKEVEVT